MSVQALNRKEAIASGEDIAPVTREEYYLKGLAEGQGGGLDYVIPEQTVTFTNNQALIQNINISGLADADGVIIKTIYHEIGDLASYEVGEYSLEDNSIYFGVDMGNSINTNTGVWEAPEGIPNNTTVTISAIRGF